MTPEEKLGSVGWKQGWCYKVIYPPYGKKNIINSRRPLAGIKYHTDIKSAYKSIVRIKGPLPPVITRDMGIMDIKITSQKAKGSPKIEFVADPKQMTTVTPVISGVRSIPQSAPKRRVTQSKSRLPMVSSVR